MNQIEQFICSVVHTLIQTNALCVCKRTNSNWFDRKHGSNDI